MRILIAMDSFKGSLSSIEVAKAVGEGIKEVMADSEILEVSIADGSEGTVQSLVMSKGRRLINVWVTGPLGIPVNAQFGLLPDKTAVIEMASASGLTLVPAENRNPEITTTYGTGELIKAALDCGASKIIIGIGGSATNDCGSGMAQALGIRLIDAEGKDIGYGGGELSKLCRIDMTGLDPRIRYTEILVVCDVKNPLCGPQGASAVYGPQKGATIQMVEELDKKLYYFADKIREQIGVEVIDIPGSGAAGGLGAGLMAFLGAELKAGIDIILDIIDMDKLLQDRDLVITGEGQIDSQSIYDKVPIGVAIRAAKKNIPVIAIVGSIGTDYEKIYEYGINSVVPIVNGPISLEESIKNATALTKDATKRAFKLLKVGKSMNKMV